MWSSFRITRAFFLKGRPLPRKQPLIDGTVLVPLGGRGVPCELDCHEAFITVTQHAARLSEHRSKRGRGNLCLEYYTGGGDLQNGSLAVVSAQYTANTIRHPV